MDDLTKKTMKFIVFFEGLILIRFLSNVELIWEAKIQPKPSPNEVFFEDKIEEVSKRDIEANLKKNSSDWQVGLGGPGPCWGGRGGTTN